MDLSVDPITMQQVLANSRVAGLPVSGAAASGSGTDGVASAISSHTQLGKDEFLKLLIAQLEHQDPLKPVDNTEMIAQTAQFSQVEQLTKVVSLLERMVTLQEAQNQPAAIPPQAG